MRIDKSINGIAWLMITLAVANAGAAVDVAGSGTPELVAVLTDYGTADYYVGALEGAIYAANPLVRISTISHQVKPFDVAEASYLLAEAAEEYPPGTVFVGGVDPQVGICRPIVVATGDGKAFVGPDNGIFTGVIEALGLVSAYEITNQSLMRSGEFSHSFNGRDIYGPVAAHLAGGAPAEWVGAQIDDLTMFPIVRGGLEDGNVSGAVVHVDRYGNLLTNIEGGLLGEAGFARGDPLEIEVGDANLTATWVDTYGDVPLGKWLLLVSPSGQVEIARNMESAADSIGASAGDDVMLHGP
ncbi:MAG: SAM-dependent chlorinase/fluorinase [Methanotrichaceae archaeon]|nr:SAM-dependent chlorinase/fluorinase [Methanotrichaceae archaeon]